MTILEDGFEIESTDLGTMLGSGSYKEALVYLPHPDHVITKSAYALGSDAYVDEMFDDERRTLHRALGLGIPCARIEASGLVLMNGTPYPANLMKRYAASNRSCRGSILAKYLNDKSIASLLRLYNRLEDLEIGLSDLQFLVAEDGEVVVNDVSKIEGKTSYAYSDSKRVCQSMLKMARYCIHCRETGRNPIEEQSWSWELEDVGSRWVRHEGSSQKVLLEKFPVLDSLSR